MYLYVHPWITGSCIRQYLLPTTSKVNFSIEVIYYGTSRTYAPFGQVDPVAKVRFDCLNAGDRFANLRQIPPLPFSCHFYRPRSLLQYQGWKSFTDRSRTVTALPLYLSIIIVHLKRRINANIGEKR